MENAAIQCINEVYKAIGIDLNKLVEPYPAINYCSFSEVEFVPSTYTLTESKKIDVISKN
ncbi:MULTISPECIES: hypothetical protein [unclassified Bacillus (in: firmicutes)]|uniref:hypothetical protein n=1 Tax=unclassified Bacillus (in: firmicutes) TaxID=185979 RepID=UPI000BF3F60D|nr:MULTISPECIES: hypothetical protein [unclassified Bacillus (in: firmicutes)]PEU18590.1 hypothetical protein CN525_10900 [Bacillus sp. AFS014408]PFW63836.1 hypothetical protein COL20_07285 [Bacillus sp. AFS075034]